ncbi:MAG TPA: hypothetical protein DCP91_08565 [Eggerthellaceae bacterium]|nr:hypothetical protein [Eggerthellaceae bacterium]
MGNCILVLGESGSGKSTSLRNFAPGEVGVLNVMGKRLPFKGGIKCADHAGYGTIQQTLKANNLKCYVVDDAGYLMQLENFRRAKESGYAKFTDIALHFEQLIEWATQTDEDTNVYLMMHYDVDANGKAKPRTVGKMIDEKFCIEGACPIVLQSTILDGRYVFVSKGDGFNAAKAPMGMLPDVMDNDLKAVDTAIREFWDMAPLSSAPKGKGKADAGAA